MSISAKDELLTDLYSLPSTYTEHGDRVEGHEERAALLAEAIERYVDRRLAELSKQ